MSQDQISIINRAITELANARIMNITDPQKAAKSMDAVYEGVRDSALAVADWSFAMQRFRPNKEISTPLFEYAYQYIIPADCLRLVWIHDLYVGSPSLGARYFAEAPKPPYRKEGGKILTDDGGPLNCRGVFRITNEAIWEPLFIDFFIWELSNACFNDLTRKGQGDRQLLLQQRDRALVIATSRGAIEQSPEEIPDTSWLLSRIGP
jgi:hypothetical protein